MKKLHSFLDKIDFFMTVVHVAWSILVVFSAAVAGMESMIFDIPQFVPYLLFAVCVIGGIAIQKWFLGNTESRAALISYQVFQEAQELVLQARQRKGF